MTSESDSPSAKPSDVQARVLQVAAKLFAERGFHAVSVRDIAGECNVSVSTVLYHGGSKQGLLERILSESFSHESPLPTFLRELDPQRITTRDEFFAVYDELIDLLVEHASSHPENRRFWLRLLFDHHDLFATLERDYTWPLFKNVRAFLAELASRGLISNDSTHRNYVVASIDWMMDGFFAGGLHDDNGQRIDATAPGAADHLVTYLKAFGRAML